MNEVTAIEARTSLLSRADLYAANEPSFARFLRATTEATDPEDLATHSADVLETLWRESYDRLGSRGYATHEVHLLPPLDLRHPEVVEVFSADMPFIVDSVLAAIRATGGSIRFMSHPTLIFDPTTFRVLEQMAPGARRESFLHIQIDPLPDDAARESMRREIDEVMTEVARVTSAWRPMLEAVQQVVQSWHDHPPGAPPPAVAEAMHFLVWLADHNFTFLGMRAYRLEGSDGEATLAPLPQSGLGILADPDYRFLRAGTDYVEMTDQHLAFLREPAPLMVTKANARSRVHRRSHMDYVGVKLYDATGIVSGELRILGLFTSSSLATPHNEVPIVRRKVAEVMQRSGLPPDGHAGKALMNALDNYPRDELFQIDVDRLLEFATAIATLPDRPRVRVFSRIDRFDNYVSILLFMPRDRYDSTVRARVGEHLARVYDGRVAAYYPSFPEGELVRVHFIISRTGGPTPRPRRDELEDQVTELTLTFGARLRLAALEPERVARYVDAFSEAYQARHSPEAALQDIEVLEGLGDAGNLALRLEPRAEEAGALRLKVYHRESPIPLSDRVPMFENFGFRVIDESTYTVRPSERTPSFVHDMQIRAPAGTVLELADDLALKTVNAVLAVWRGEAESDGLNQLTLTAALSWYDVGVLRALTRYLKQVGIAYSRRYLISVLARHSDVAEALVTLFHALNDPEFAGHRERAAAAARDRLDMALATTQSLDEDRIIRRYINLVEAVLRTNAYQRDAAGDRRPALALKFDCAAVTGLPEPRPYREVFVYSPRVEGLHMRFGPIARGGIRWSDRPEDFRTELLGLAKAQQVKNAIIVPVGAKGAYVPQRLPTNGDRDAVLREATECYTIFVSTLLDVTDNLSGDFVEPPPELRRRDDDDPYLVVAADKGTASFSDIANAISLDRGYWLGDAFASGGATGYDHKKMGITARGAWECVKRHFRERDRDIQTEPVSVVGVGDMSGDVFGNGMLLSPQIRLVAAFDHRDIFIDPDPDPVRSLTERARLFLLPRSSWQDYDRSLISKGGGVYSRSHKSVSLFAEARQMLGLGSEELTPADVISAILRAKVDLLWFGGIGTYVRASDESDAEVGDRANDPVRITAPELGAKVVGEGANLGLTQRARIEFAQLGGRINTDAIDNSAGVNSSDLEVNIKIALDSEVREGRLTRSVRDEVLSAMTDEVATLCLRNNYLQSLALSVAEYRGTADLPDQMGLLDALEAAGLLRRDVEFLPTNAELAERGRNGHGLTRPELAILVAYAKNAVFAELRANPKMEDPYLGRELYRYFPDHLVENFRESVSTHRLRREVIATVLANAMVNRGGPAFVHAIVTATNADAGQVAAAAAAARDAFDLPALNAAVDGLDNRVPGLTQVKLYAELSALLRRQTLWFLRNTSLDQGLVTIAERYRGGIEEVRAALPRVAPPGLQRALEDRTDAFEAAGVPRDVARLIGELSPLGLATDMILVAQRAVATVPEAAEAYFGVMDRFALGGVIDMSDAIVLADPYDRLALDRALANLTRAQRDLTGQVLAAGSGAVAARLELWHELRAHEIDRAAAAVAELTEGEITVSRLSVAAGLLADLARES